MADPLRLNKPTAGIAGITPRQAQSWSDKGLVVPAREATGGGSKRGYDYNNFIELALCRELFGMGLSIQYVKRILGILREDNLLHEWIDDKEFFRKQYVKGVWGNIVDTEDTKGLKELESSLQRMFYEPIKDEKPNGILFYSFTKPFANRAFIFPRPKYSISSDRSKTANAVKYLYHRVTEGKVIVVNIGRIRDDIDKAITKI